MLVATAVAAIGLDIKGVARQQLRSPEHPLRVRSHYRTHGTCGQPGKGNFVFRPGVIKNEVIKERIPCYKI